MRNAAEEYGCIKTLVTKAKTETVVDLRDSGVSDCNLVKLVYISVTVDILVLDISWLNVTECLYRPSVDICLVLEKTARDKTLSLLFMRQGIKKDILCAKWVLSS